MITIHSCRLEKLQKKVPIPTKRDCSHLAPEIFLKKVSHRNKVHEKKLIRKAKEVGGKKAKRKSQNCSVTFRVVNFAFCACLKFASKYFKSYFSKYRPEVYKSEKSKILKKIHKVALGKLLT